MQELSRKKIKIIRRDNQNVSHVEAPKKGLKFPNFFSVSAVATRTKKDIAVSQEPVFKSSPMRMSRSNLTDIRSWVALEEKIVQDYREQKTVSSPRPVLLPKSPEKKIPPPTVETFTVPGKAPLSPKTFKKEPFHGPPWALALVGYLLVCGWLAAGTFIFLHVRETRSNRENLQRLAYLQNDKQQQVLAYTALKNVSENQQTELKRLRGQFHDAAEELRIAKIDRAAYAQGLEKKYREELMQITVRYESQLANLRNTVGAQKAIVNALKVQSQVFEKLMDQVGIAAFSGVAARFSQEPFSRSGTSVLQGEVTSIHEQQRFVLINLGAAQGARSGRRITIFRRGTPLATARIDRVYPSISAALIENADMLRMIQEGDSVSFS